MLQLLEEKSPWMLLTNNLYQEIWNKSMTKPQASALNIPEEWGKILTENNFFGVDPN